MEYKDTFKSCWQLKEGNHKYSGPSGPSLLKGNGWKLLKRHLEIKLKELNQNKHWVTRGAAGFSEEPIFTHVCHCIILWHMTSCFDSPGRSCLIVFGHCSISKCVFCGQSGHSHISSSSQPQQHSSTIVNNHRGVWWAPASLSSKTWLLNDAWEEGSGL